MEVLVSVNCITYNHEDYIAQAIEGFLNQKTNFEFEILIGEDCSTDQTLKIVEEYRALNPHKIRLITSDRNVGAMNNSYRLLEASKGKYIALCEGDDYWTDPYKLQKQVDYMEGNPDCTFCFHNGTVINAKTDQQEREVIPWMGSNRKYYYGKNHSYDAGKLALLGYIPTASFLFPKELLRNLPDWCATSVVGDNVIKLITTSHGYAYYIDEVMCAYRFGVRGSATTNWVKENNNKQKQINQCHRFIELYNHFNDYSNNRFKEDIDRVIQIFDMQIAVINGEFKDVREKYRELYREMTMKEKLKVFVRCYFPTLYITLTKIKVS